MATAILTPVDARGLGDPLTVAEWTDQLKDNINQLIGLRSRNLLTNGGFEVWQRGAGPWTTGGAEYTSDRWYFNRTVPAATVTQETTTIDGGAASLKMVAAGGGVTISQLIEDYRQLRGKTVSVSVRVQQSVASAITVGINDGVSGFTYGSASVTTGSWVTITCSSTLSASASALQIVVAFGAAGTYYLDNAMLVMGPAPTAYVPLHPQEELARCQRYYEVHGGVNPSMAMSGYGAAGNTIQQIIVFATAKAVTPTITKNGTWAVTNCAQPVANAAHPGGYSLSAVVTATGAASFNANSADDTITAEANI